MNNFEKPTETGGGSDWGVLESEPTFGERMAQANSDSVNHELDQEKLENFDKLVDFFKRDASIKKTLVDLAPDEMDETNNDGAAYSDKIYNGFQDIKFDLSRMMEDNYDSEIIKKRLREIEKQIILSGSNFDKLSKVYQRDFAAMSEEFNDELHKNVFGYYMFSDPHSMDEKATSVNEILHLVHSAVTENRFGYDSLPVLAENQDSEVKLYGTNTFDNSVAREIFDGMKDDEYPADIVSMGDHILMMVRDKGHALTVDAEKDPDGKWYINYFVPKICNVDKVNLLPGVRKVQKKEGVNQVRDFTTGVFAVDEDGNVADEILSFIAAVPTDEDIPR